MSTATLLLLLLGLFSFASCNTHTVNSPLAIQQASDQENVLNSNTANPTLPDIWESLGPFPHGSREIGSDLLSAYGGFENLPYSETATYPSELVDGGFVRWRKVQTEGGQSVSLSYPEVRWDFNQKPFGWASLQHSAYFRGTFNVERAGVYLVELSGVVSFKVDDRPLVGNVYGYNHAASSAIHLTEGEHALYVYAVHDVRISGGHTPPVLRFRGGFTPVDVNNSNHGIVVFPADAVIPDVIEERLATPFASVTILNANITSSDASSQESGWLQVFRAHGTLSDGTKINVTLPVHFSVKLAPGQVTSVPLNLSIAEFPREEFVKIDLEFVDLDSYGHFIIPVGEFFLERRTFHDAFKITFLDYDLSVQHAMVRVPKQPCSSSTHKCPVVLALHGAGVEASNPFWTESYQQRENAWVLYPTGRTSWGFDWHGPSHRNVEYALDALHVFASSYRTDMAVNRNKLVYVGHSNGGQGAWWMASHYPDKALAAMPASGFIKHQFYVPFYFRVGDSYADPMLRGIMDSSIAEHDIDLYSGNMAGVPVLARHGAIDDNVPPLHSRKLVRLMNEFNRNPFSTNLSEIPAQGHWFDGVVDDDTMQSFLAAHLNDTDDPQLSLPPLPDVFSLITLNPASTGSKGGIRILQLEVPFRLGSINIRRFPNRWELSTSNIRRFGFVRDPRQEGVQTWSVDGTEFNKPPSASGPSYSKLSADSAWVEEQDFLWIRRERHPSTYGPIQNIFNEPFIIVIPSKPTNHSALYRWAAQHIATSWYIYARGITQIVRDVDVLDGIAARYNLIVLGGPEDNEFAKRRANEGIADMVKFLPEGGYQIDKRTYTGPGTGILFLAPSTVRTRVAVFIAGTDENGFQKALWTIPFRTGLQVPDYLVVGEEYGDPHSGWTGNGKGTKGVGGILAAGYWNNSWSFDPRCGYLK